MTEAFFLEHYAKLKSLEAALGEMPEVEELVDEARAAGLDVDALLGRYRQPPDVLLWV